MTFIEAISKFTRNRQALNYSKDTTESQHYILAVFTRWLASSQGVSDIKELRSGHLENYQQHLANRTTSKGHPIKPSTINGAVSTIRVFLAYMVQHNHIPARLENILQRVKEPQLLPTSVLKHSEVKELLEHMDTTTPAGYRNRTMLELLYTCAIRRSELLSLTLPDLDLDNAVIRVTGKGSKERVVPVGKTALRFLSNYLKAIRPTWLNSTQTQALFLSCRGKPLGRAGIKWLFKTHFHEASVHVTPHTFRRSCTTELVRSGANLYHIKELLGHASLSSLRPYTKLTALDVRQMHAKYHPREHDEEPERD